ncbi:hypothetical protein [Thauera propionica]|uniref:hypothetical protein n=1 Tax=Thauera propionica TaxID=2019431 RepID=UPI001055897B|nr:hypothetical protein [Thauera propionica]
MSDHLDDLGYEEVRHRLDRGDYLDPYELKVVKKWLHRQEKEQEFIASCKRATISSALETGRVARRANWIAVLALLISAIGAREHIVALLETILSYLGR